ncbi:Mitochondrial calcium uniporter regulator 1 [Galemys pyrenaicus]|uniref:Mitochondrial calcium uniporter regulator 1 n=1 Tax=Galemys pyrenaicus TaxID=202257 RepID=A0A8J6DLT9_GALPY|nr:Mitochondrial calcium uniporter regulator 1 [Galemys pyrenaicus]
MDCGSVAGERPKPSPGRRRLLLFLPASRCGSPGGRGVPARRCLSAFPGGLGALRPRVPAVPGGASRASPLLLLLLVPSPRLAAAAPRRPLGDWECSRLGPTAPSAGRGGAGRCPAGLGPGVLGAASALHLCHGSAAALASSRRELAALDLACDTDKGNSMVWEVCRLVFMVLSCSFPPLDLVLNCIVLSILELSLSSGCLQLERRRKDFTSSGSRKLYFDTHALVCLLEENGFTTQQAEIIVSALVKIMDANMDIVYKDMVTKMQQEITLQQIMSQISNVKKDMIILEKSEFSMLRAENEKMKLELHQLKQQVMDEVLKVRTDTKLDFNLEKSRVKELVCSFIKNRKFFSLHDRMFDEVAVYMQYSLNERKLLEMKTEMVALHAKQDRAVTQTDRKIDTEVAGLKTMLESHKLDNIKYLADDIPAVIVGRISLSLGPLTLLRILCSTCPHPSVGTMNSF